MTQLVNLLVFGAGSDPLCQHLIEEVLALRKIPAAHYVYVCTMLPRPLYCVLFSLIAHNTHVIHTPYVYDRVSPRLQLW